MGEKSPKIDHIPPQFSQPTLIHPHRFPARGHEPRKPRTKAIHADQKPLAHGQHGSFAAAKRDPSPKRHRKAELKPLRHNKRRAYHTGKHAVCLTMKEN